ncbi:2-succinyl-5-enolpyruvyl-6-hydroxy-3-cyclohexene-1-carboxylic-acid synthase [Streptomyces sp. AP-93]|uniref:2-succinyl-5-enolpyruvyl-6-hydroxy-3- cyclohexene-1-carboxylic-acid synthase n=1 Tax=Streptomyces sp. AP-93 TaxID=2929048 RepID=UPI001FAEB260|nr:2-succinyl-5-enolpyruvyl-6-hydroxy-3-cyclohexene-1-carboxylic-acid synthase [Streptomyces sp. AP-93]MCJ0874992.1 2-succinyl-5-enolpyruvyl-6-hydroxy-3-cyclohexene-1-carboxylic-acid synthase [Streptomyces sp. AP-93]
MTGPAVHPAEAMAEVLIDELIRNGACEAVLSPGSRSAPLALALHEADRTGRLRLHVRIDERSAAFLALGLAKASGRPVPVLCTSGTAAANFHPAVVEADLSCVPLLVLTADRPPELRDTGAPQTIDQIRLYGGAVRWFCETGVPERRAGAVAYWRSLAARAYGHATGSHRSPPGPVHLNIAFRDPLVPTRSGSLHPWPEPLAGRPEGEPWCRTTPHRTAEGEPLPATERGVLLLGDGCSDPTPLVAHAQRAGWPVLAEPTSGGRYGPNALTAYPYLLRVPGFLDAHRPDLVVSAGRPGLTRQQTALLHAARAHVVVPGTYPADPARTARAHVHPCASPQADADQADSDNAAPPPSRWMASWLRADRAVREALDALLDDGPAPTAPGIVRALARRLPPGGLLFTGPSLCIRDLDQHLHAPTGTPGPRVLANRGASGIDGVVSSAIGAALAHGGPAWALMGDLTLLHDHNGLLLGPDEPVPDLAILVINNDGGGIFSLLEQAEHTGPFERIFGTPHSTDLSLLAEATGTPYTLLTRSQQLTDVLSGKGLRLIEVRTDRTRDTELRAALQAAAGRAVASMRPPGRIGE